MAATAFITSAVLTTAAGVQQIRATSAQNDAQRRAARLERARARIEANANIRRSIAAARRQRAEIIAGTQSENQGGNSAVQGVVGSLQTGTAVAAGDTRTQLAARTGQSLLLQRGASTAARLNNSAALFQIGSTVASGFGELSRFRSPNTQPLNSPNG